MKRVIALLMVVVLAIALCACSFGKEIKELNLSSSELEMTVGDTKTIEVTAEPEKAELVKLTWSSSDNDIVKVEDGTVKALKAGAVVVSVKSENGVSDSCNITVKDKSIKKIKLNKTTTSLDEGSTIQLEADIEPVDAPKDLKWSSNDETVATVNSEGYVTGVSAGVVNIVCKSSNDVEASCTVTVKEKATQAKSEPEYSKPDEINQKYNGHFRPDYVYSATDFVFPESSIRELSRAEISSTLANMTGYSPSGSYAQDAINEIYARNGYVFKNSEIRAYYESKPWYYADSSFSTADFSSVERYNLALIEEYD